jgi:hypothetical protein
MSEETNYGPLTHLIGTWKGTEGIDIAPEPDGVEENPYYETIEYVAAGDVTNAEAQTLAILRYHQVVKRKSNDKIFHDEVGYWMWDANTDIIVHSLAIPRAVCVLAGGHYTHKTENNSHCFEVSASEGDEDWQIIQSPFMKEKAKTKSFHHSISIQNNIMTYKETTILDIYGKDFEHVEENTLSKE